MCVDVEHGYLSRYALIPVNIHGSQMLPMLHDLEGTDDYLWANSAYERKCFEDLLGRWPFKVAFRKRGAAIIRLISQPKSGTVFNKQSELRLNTFYIASIKMDAI